MNSWSATRAFAEGNGLPISLELASANHHEVTLAVPALQTVCASTRRGQAEAASKRVGRRQGLRQQALQAVVAFEGNQTDHSGIRASCEEASQARATGKSRIQLRGALEGGEDLRLARKLPAALGAPRTPPFDLPGILTTRFHPHVPQATLKCKELREDGIEVEALDEGSAVAHTNLVEDVREMILDGVLGDV